MQALQVTAHPLELVLLRPDPDANASAAHRLCDSTEQRSTTFAYLAVRLPGSSCASGVAVAHAGKQQACEVAGDGFGAAYVAAFADCSVDLCCEARTHALFAVYALRVQEVCTIAPPRGFPEHAVCLTEHVRVDPGAKQRCTCASAWIPGASL